MILVTGGTGLVGSHLLVGLASREQHIKAIYRDEKSIENVKKIFNYYYPQNADFFQKIEWVQGDLLNLFKLDEIIKDVKHLYHCAAIVSFNASDKETLLKNNVQTTANIVNLSLEKQIEKLCFVSSIGALGRNNPDLEGYIDENVHFNKNNKNSVYSLSKYLSEQEVWRGIAEGLNAVIVNPSIILGPSDPNKGSTQLIKKVKNGLMFYTKGVNGYVDVRDVANIMIQLTNSNIKNERFIVSAENLSYKELFDSIAKNLNKPKPKIKINKTLSEIAWRIESIRSIFTGSKPLITQETARTANNIYYYSNEKIKKQLNYKFITIEEAIENTCKYLSNSL